MCGVGALAGGDDLLRVAHSPMESWYQVREDHVAEVAVFTRNSRFGCGRVPFSSSNQVEALAEEFADEEIDAVVM